MKKPRVLLADDHTFVLEGFKKLLEDYCDILEYVEDGCALFEATVSLQPEVVILDISMPLLNGIETAKKLKKQTPQSETHLRHNACRYGLCRRAFSNGGVWLLAKTIGGR